MQREENLKLVQQLYRAFEQRDIPGLLDLLSPDIDWLFYGPESIPFTGHYRGHAGVAEFFQKALDCTELLQIEPREFSATQHNVLVEGHERGRAKATGRDWETHWAHVFAIESGRIVRMREYYDTAVLVDAFAA